MKRRLQSLALAALVCIPLSLQKAQASGGHHSVDDAAILDPGECKVETWGQRERGGGQTLVHLGSGCRIGALELALNLERTRSSVDGNASTFAPQLKWARPIGAGLSAGLSATAAWQASPMRNIGSTLVALLTWEAGDSINIHANLGRDFTRDAADLNRAGAAIEWSPRAGWTIVGERFRESNVNYRRMGVRLAVTESLGVDLSHARELAGGTPALWTAGLTWTFDR